ncbi:MAG: response regulator [Ferruginibacter sp.]|nr:response regulator [Cytophagales bacterium]
MTTDEYTILYVDDEPQNLISFRACFRRDYRVLTAGSAREGLVVLRQTPVQLIITDQRMPDMTGVQFLEKIIPDYPDPIRMILTGFSDVEAIIKAINTGQVFRYITKPWEENELRMTIDNALNLYCLQQKNKQLIYDLQEKVREQEKTLRLFQRYVPSPIVDKAMSAPGDAALFEGESRHVAVLFCDIRDFTALSERIAPREVVSLLNAYYRLMSDAVQRHNGCVNQYVGDEVFAVFGAPVSNPQNEANAVMCALDMLDQLRTLNEQHAPRLAREIQVGIGINAGEVVAGNLGSDDKIEYSITGDTVNTGKRIECLTKDRPNCVLISESTYDRVKDLVHTTRWEPLEVKGKLNRVTVYEVSGRK